MKRLLLFVLSVGALASCAPKKYAYHFDRHDYNAGKKAQQVEKAEHQITAVEMESKKQELVVSPKELSADATVKSSVDKNKVAEKIREIGSKYQSFKNADSKVTGKEIRKELKNDLKDLKKELKNYVKEKKNAPSTVEETNEINKNLKIALILFVAAIIATIFSYILGGILWLVGLIFLILWLVEL